MGLSRMSGPVYGAKANLVSGFYAAVSSATSQVIASITLPSYESWVVTELIAHCSSCTTGVARISVLDDSTNLGTATFVSTAASVVQTITPTAGEYEGAVVAAGSALTLAANSGSTALPMGSIQWTLRGYTRFESSTRAE